MEYTKEIHEDIKDDHDKLLKIEVKINQICKNQGEMKKDLKDLPQKLEKIIDKLSNKIIEQQLLCQEHRESIAKGYVSRGWFFFTITVLVIGFVGKIFLMG